jgi:isopentenyl diphosphate isomerase/L-lactate dehydrogenase-like FMN-dependent dehydrogenase
VVLYGDVYDVTHFLDQHPGGAKSILQLSGRDATEDFDAIHPSGTLSENDLTPLGKLDPSSSPPAMDAKPRESKVEKEPEVRVRDLLNLDEIEALATKRMSRKAWAYYSSAADDSITKTANNAIYKSIILRPRIFKDVSSCSTRTTLLGHALGTPLYVSPAAMARLGHPLGEAGIAQGVSRFGALQVMSNYASMSPEQIMADAKEGQIFGWQLYVQGDRSRSEKQLARISKMEKIKFVALTLDTPVVGKREIDERVNNGMTIRDDSSTVRGESKTALPGSATSTDLTWRETLEWLGRHTDLPIVLKGVQTYEDANVASRCEQVKAIVVSNHGGRNLDTAPTPVHTLLEIRRYCPEVFEKVEVWVDGGIKRGTDVVKALCLGATAVGVGRAALFGLGAGGVEGVERTFESEFHDFGSEIPADEM